MRSGGPPEPSKAGLFLSSGQKAQGQILEAEPLGFMRTEKEEEEQEAPGPVLFERLELMTECHFQIRSVTPAQHHPPAVTLLPVGELG